MLLSWISWPNTETTIVNQLLYCILCLVPYILYNRLVILMLTFDLTFLFILILCVLSYSIPEQIGRSSESPIDFVVMDTLPGDKKDAKVMQSTISRFACRILVGRCDDNRPRIFAAGFDSSRNIFLGVIWLYYYNISTRVLDCRAIFLCGLMKCFCFRFQPGESNQMAG